MVCNSCLPEWGSASRSGDHLAHMGLKLNTFIGVAQIASQKKCIAPVIGRKCLEYFTSSSCVCLYFSNSFQPCIEQHFRRWMG